MALFLPIAACQMQRSRQAEQKPATEAPSAGSAGEGSPETALATSVHVALGVPTDATPADEHIMIRPQFVLSYNRFRNGPNWVAWRLTTRDLGTVRRTHQFRPDDALPSSFYHVTPRDFAHTGFDRGHLCPSGDRSANAADNAATFVMSNTLPQDHELNAGPWEKLEQHERALARAHDVFIVAGGTFGERPRTIGNGVAVPKASWKIIVAVTPGLDARDVTLDTFPIAVQMPNDPSAGTHPWIDYLTSVASLEQDTGYDFLSTVPDSVEHEIERRVAPLAATRIERTRPRNKGARRTRP